MKTPKLFFFILIMGFFFASCQQEFQPDIKIANENERAEKTLNSIFVFVMENTVDQENALFDEPCITKLVENLEDDFVKLTATYDSIGCIGKDEIKRRGQIVAVYRNNWFDDLNKDVIVTFNNFSQDDVLITGEIKITFFGLKDLKPEHELIATRMRLVFPDDKEFNWSGTHYVIWREGHLTIHDKKDDIIEINSELSGVNTSGETFTTYGEQLIEDFSCSYRQFISGEYTITKTGSGDLVKINYGTGECDGEYIVSQNGVNVSVGQ